MDAERYAQRFTPRRKGSKYSQLNKERLRPMIKQNKVIPSLKEEIKKSKAAWKNFIKMSENRKMVGTPDTKKYFLL